MRKWVAAATAWMLCGITAFATPLFSDLEEAHWGYGAISNLVQQGTVNGYEDGTFRPNNTVTFAEFKKMVTGIWEEDSRQIPRGEALKLLWEHNGSPVGYTAPGIITSQAEGKDAVAWGYETGLMIGNDGLNLRLGDTLTRAEAAVLIERSKTAESSGREFADTVSESILQTIWEAYGLFEGGYLPNKEITKYEAGAAAARLDNGEAPVEADNSIISMEDAAALLITAAVNQWGQPLQAADLSSVPEKYGMVTRMCMAYALENGVLVPEDKPATAKEIAALLLQLDDLFGRDGVRINKDLELYPQNSGAYRYIIEGIPKQVYETPFGVEAQPRACFEFASSYASIYRTLLGELEQRYPGAKFTYYPSLVCETDEESILRVACEVNGEKSAADLFGPEYQGVNGRFYMDIHTGSVPADLQLPVENASIGQLVYTESRS